MPDRNPTPSPAAPLIHSATRFYAFHELDARLGHLGWAMLAAGGPLDATEVVSAGAITSMRQFPEQLLVQR